MNKIVGSSSFLNLDTLFSFSLVLLLLSSCKVLGSSRDFSRKLQASTSGICSIASTLRQYQCEDMQVTTEDGYILSISRIGGANGGNQGPVLLQHGLTADGMCWVAGNPDRNLPTILADNGFDVFISSIRGTQFSRRHTRMTSFNMKYWDWSWEELAEKDLPALVGFVFELTGQKVHYIGHSLGTLMALAALAEGIAIDQLKSVVLLSPIAYLRHTMMPPSIMSSSGSISQMGPSAAIQASQMPSFGGKNCCLKLSTMTRYIQHKTQPSSYKNSVHLFQIGVAGKVRKFDYMLGNMARYGQPRPPIYDMTKIPRDFPLFLSYGGQDTLSDLIDVKILLRDLAGHDPDKLKTQLVNRYAHVDFIMADNAHAIVYSEILNFFSQHA